MRTFAHFIDAGHLDKTLAASGIRRIEFDRLLSLLAIDAHTADSEEVFASYYYDCLPYLGMDPSIAEREQHNAKRSFFAAIGRTYGLTIRLGVLARRDDLVTGRSCFTQKRVDGQITSDMVLLAARGHITDAILLTGDSDLIPAVETAKDQGIRVHLFHGSSAHRDLIDACDTHTPLTTQRLFSMARRAGPTRCVTTAL
jgi:uncharacterized LabA/DUF88 family protein